jgi:hypothetical protein
MIQAVEDVRNRLYRATAALDAAQVPYAVVGGNAVAAWVSRVDKAAVRNTQDVDLLLHRSDLERAKTALGTAGFVYRHAASIDMFLDGPSAKARDAVHVIFADEKVRPADVFSTPRVSESERTADYALLNLDALVRMKLTSFRDKDRVHLRDFLEVGLIDDSWLPRVPAELQDRLKLILETPDG